MHPFVLVAADQDQEFGQGKKVSIIQKTDAVMTFQQP